MARSETSEWSPITDAVQQTMDAATQDPFEIMRLGEEMENQYLSDAKGRLTDPDLWGPSVQTEIRELALGTSPDIETKLEDLNCKFQQVTCKSILSLRADIMNMARTILEILSDPDPEVQKECHEQLKDTMERIVEEFRQQEEEFNMRSKRHGLCIVALLESSQRELWKSALGAKGALATMFITLAMGRLAWLATYRPQDLLWTSFVNTWYKPDYKDSNGNLHYKKMTAEEGGVRFKADWVMAFSGLTPIISIFTFGFFSLWTIFSLRRKKALEIQAGGEKVVKSDLEKHKRMWEGVRMCVYSVQKCFDLLSGLSAGRKMHRDTAIKQMAQSLWSMSMAVDEMTVWMQGRGCFPPNFSVRNLIGAARHDRIKSVLDEARTARPALRICVLDSAQQPHGFSLSLP